MFGVAPREGFEPPTLSLEVSCSIQLSYQGTPIPPDMVLGLIIAKNCSAYESDLDLGCRFFCPILQPPDLIAHSQLFMLICFLALN